MKLYSQDASGGTTGGDSTPTQATAASSSAPSPAANPTSSSQASSAASTPSQPAVNTTKGPLAARIKEVSRQRDAAAKAAAGSTQAQAGASSPPATGAEVHTPSTPVPSNSPEPGVPSTPEPPAAAPVPEPGLADIIRDQFGVDFSQKYKSDQELLAGLVHATRMVGARDMDAEYGRAYRQYEPEFRQFMANRQGQGQHQGPQSQPVQQTQQQQVPWQGTPWDVPQFNPQWRDFLTEVQDPVTGDKSIGFKPGTPLAIQQQVDDYRAKRAQFEHAWTENPAGMVANLVVPIAQQIAQQAFQQNLGHEKSQATAQMIFEQNTEWMYARDQAGNVIYDGFTGRPSVTPRGQAYLRNVERFAPMTPDPAQLHQLAMEATQGQLALQVLQSLQQQPQSNGQPTVPSGRQPQSNGSPRTPAGAVHRPNATATGAPAPSAPPTYPSNMRLSEKIRQAVRAAQGGAA